METPQPPMKSNKRPREDAGTLKQNLLASIDLLSDADCKELKIDAAGGLPKSVQATDCLPESIVAVVRPKSFTKRLDQQSIVRDNLEMILQITRRRASDGGVGDHEHVYSVKCPASSHKELHGLYFFPLSMIRHLLFEEPGIFMFSFSLTGFEDIQLEHEVQVRELAGIGRWEVLGHYKNEPYTVRVGSCFRPLSLAIVCCTEHKKRLQFTSVPDPVIKLISGGKSLVQVLSKTVEITPDKLIMKIEDISIESNELDDIRPNYEATLHISSPDEAFSVALPCRVIPATLKKITVHDPTVLPKKLLPGQVIEELALEAFDEYGNHLKENDVVLLRYDGLSTGDGRGIAPDVIVKKVDANGRVDLSKVFKVSRGNGKTVGLSVRTKDEFIFELRFDIESEPTPRTRSSDILQSQVAAEVSEDLSNSALISQKVHLEMQQQEKLTEDVGNPILPTPRSSECGQIHPVSPSPRASQLPNETLFPRKFEQKDLENPSEQKLMDDVLKWSLKASSHERNLESLKFSLLQAVIASAPDLGENASSLSSLRSTLEQTQSRSQSAAAVVCKMLEEELTSRGIVGVVALLATVESTELSRMLAQYLGEDQMLAIVCRNYDALHKLATHLGCATNEGYHAVCLEEIRPRSKEPLALQDPALPNGNAPRGFLGYAVDLISIERNHQYCRTTRGHGLRETLFYRLFGELQVYQDKECMMGAQSCIKAGAVSLDGAILRGNGLYHVGHWESKILFPVMNKATSPERLRMLAEKEMELAGIQAQMDVEEGAYRQSKEKLDIFLEKYKQMYVSKGAE